MQYMSELAAQAKDKLVAKTGAGNDFLGWIDLPVDYDKEEFDRIKKAAAKIREDSEVLLVIGIGGSYLGARAAIEFLGHSFANVVPKRSASLRRSITVGNSISSTYVKDLMDVVGDRDSIRISIQRRSLRSRSAYLKRSWRRNTAKRALRRGSMQRQTGRREPLRTWLQRKATRLSSYRTTWADASPC